VQIEVKGRNLAVSDELRECVARRFEKVGKQVAEQAVLEVELSSERQPASPELCIAEAALHLKGTTLRARESSREIKHSIHLVADDMARQVKRHRDKRRNRRAAPPPVVEPGGEAAAAL